MRSGSLIRRIMYAIQSHSPGLISRQLDTLRRPPFSSYSLYGEDALLHGWVERLAFEGSPIPHLSYLDVGAWRPVRGSNTYWLYKLGAQGTLVEANPFMIPLLRRARPRDLIVAAACSNLETVTLLQFDRTSASNSIHPEFAQAISDQQNIEVGNKICVPGRSLQTLIEQHMSDFGGLFLLTIDIEGGDDEAILSASWNRAARPLFIVAELAMSIFEDFDRTNAHSYLQSVGYTKIANCGVSTVYGDLLALKNFNT